MVDRLPWWAVIGEARGTVGERGVPERVGKQGCLLEDRELVVSSSREQGRKEKASDFYSFSGTQEEEKKQKQRTCWKSSPDWVDDMIGNQ